MSNLEAVLARGKGCLVISIHMGSWEGLASYWGGRSEPTSLITEVLEPPALWEKVKRMRETTGMSIIPLTRSAPREILRRLRANGMVTGAIDRDLVGNGVPLPFFGRLAPIPLGLFEIAQRSGAGVLPVVATREAGDFYRFEGFPPIWVEPGEEGVKAAAQRCLAIFEEEVRKRPDQWHVLSPIWSGDAAPLAAAAAYEREVRVG
jgi:KDO2-lipid IV(A) lauroyltransferase